MVYIYSKSELTLYPFGKLAQSLLFWTKKRRFNGQMVSKLLLGAKLAKHCISFLKHIHSFEYMKLL